MVNIIITDAKVLLGRREPRRGEPYGSPRLCAPQTTHSLPHAQPLPPPCQHLTAFGRA